MGLLYPHCCYVFDPVEQGCNRNLISYIDTGEISLISRVISHWQSGSVSCCKSERHMALISVCKNFIDLT